MSSLIQGLTYDIFISYRQKDNKGERWVAGFIDALRAELETTSKEDLSIYFDENPHDGLHESHDVDASLKEKLRAAILIPIVSRTYCDTRSFAWENEFKPFVHQAINDKFGIKVRLPNGNVASRVLPIRIHEISTDDIRLFESETQLIMRPIDFVFKAPGVNRPLLPSDKKEENASHTSYRDQINKVANSAYDIVEAMRSPVAVSVGAQTSALKDSAAGKTASRSKWILGSIALVIAFVVAIAWVNFQGVSEQRLDKTSIAVLPFTNLNASAENEVICNSIAEDILTKLGELPELKVPSRLSSSAYKNTTKSARSISNELGVRFILEGSVLVSGDVLKITCRLIDAQEDEIIWSKVFDREVKEYFKLQEQVARTVVSSLPLKTRNIENNLSTGEGFDLKAYESYKVGLRNYDEGGSFPTLENIVPFFEEAIRLDSTIYPAYVGIANAYIAFNHYGRGPRSELYPKAKAALDRCRALKSDYPPLYTATASAALSFEFDKASYQENIEKAMRLDPNNPEIYFIQAGYYMITKQFDKAYENFDKAIELDPARTTTYTFFKGYTHYMQRDFPQAMVLFDDCLSKFPNDNQILWAKGLVHIQLGEYQKAIDIFHRRTQGTNTNWALANAYAKLGKTEEVNKILSYNLERSKIGYVSPAILGHIYLAAGQKEEACTQFLKQLDSGDGGVYFLEIMKFDPRVDDLKGHPCYEKIMSKMPL